MAIKLSTFNVNDILKWRDIEKEITRQPSETPPPLGTVNPNDTPNIIKLSKQEFKPTKQEQEIINYHTDTVKQGKQLINEDGSVTTVYSTGIKTPDGKFVSVPGYNRETGKIMSEEEAYNYWQKDIEAGKFPIYDTGEELNKRSQELHKLIEEPKAIKIDWEFIGQQEGTKLEGYVPDSKESNSGVTIATGFDLGQRNAEDLKDFPQELQDKFSPYLGLKKEEADKKLKEKPLTITKEEQQLIDKTIKQKESNKIIESYEKTTGKKFSDLSKQQQTVIVSVGFQYGDLATKTPKFWKAITEGNWESVETELRNFGDRYDSRRKREADYLITL